MAIVEHEPRHELGREGDDGAVGDHGQLGNEGEDGQPDADVLGRPRQRPPQLRERFEGVDADLEEVVEEGEEGAERERHHKQRDEAELDHHLQVLVEEGQAAPAQQLHVPFPWRLVLAVLVAVV